MYIDTSSLQRFIGELRRADLKSGIADGLNMVGDAVRREVTESIAVQAGLTPSQVAWVIDYSPATGKRLRYDIRVREKDLQDILSRGGREWQTRQRDFDEKLVNVLTMRDDRVCPICEQIAEDGPYSIAEINHLKVLHPHFLRTDLNCRCQLVPFAPKKRLQMSTSLIPDTGEIVRMTVKQMAAQLEKRMKMSLRIKR